MPSWKTRQTRLPASFTGAPGRWWLNFAVPILPVLACFLGGATVKWSEGIVVALFGAMLLINPPKVSLGWGINLTLLALVLCAATAFLPANWFVQPPWRTALVEDFSVILPGTLSPQPWISLGCFLSFVAGLSWLYYVSTLDLDLREVRTQLRNFAFGVACLTALCIALRSGHTALSFWHNERGFGPFPNRNQTANLFGLTAVVILACGQEDIRHGRKRWILWLIALAVVIAGIVLDFSRAGVILLVAGSALWLGAFALRQGSAGGIVLVLWRVFPLREGTNQRFRVAALIAALLFAAHGIVDVSAHRVGTAFAALFLLGLAIRRPLELPRSRVVPIVFRVIGLLLLAAGTAWVVAKRYEKPFPGAVGVENEMRLATAANRSRNFSETIERTTRALGWAPLRWQLYFLRALGETGTASSIPQAADDFRRARFLEPNLYEVPFEAGKVWLSANQPTLALTAWREALRRARSQRQDIYRLMLTAARQSNPRVLEGLEELAMVHHDLALVFFEVGGGAAFMSALDRFFEHDPTLQTMSAEEKSTLFKYWAERGDAVALVRAVETHPDWMAFAWRGLAKYHASQKNFRAAIELVRQFGQAPTLPPPAQNSSIEQLRQALHANPDNYGIGFQLYRAQMESGLVDEALMTVRHFTDLPDCPRYFHFLEAEAWAAKQDWERAWKAREKFEAGER